jgi:hypothetical protein
VYAESRLFNLRMISVRQNRSTQAECALKKVSDSLHAECEHEPLYFFIFDQACVNLIISQKKLRNHDEHYKISNRRNENSRLGHF